jgi:addiction module HigA family antidote
MRASKNPSHPGEILAELYLKEMELSQSELARRIGCSHAKISEIVNGRRGITPEFALQLERVLGVKAETWVNLQGTYDLWAARQKMKKKAS